MKVFRDLNLVRVRHLILIPVIFIFNLTIVCWANSGNPTLKFSPAATHVPVKQGGTVTDLFTIATGGSFQGNVSLAVSGLPGGVSASWSRNPVSISSGTGTSTLTLQPSATATTNWFNFTVTASGDGLSVSEVYTIEIMPAVGVQIQLSQPALAIDPRGTAVLSVTATPKNGIRIPTNLAGVSAKLVSGLPTGVSASWSSPKLTGSSAVTWQLTLQANGAADTGNYPQNLYVQITDQSSGVVYSGSPGFPLLVSLLASVAVNRTPGAYIPPNFMGLSLEWGSAQSIMGQSSTGVNMIFRQLLNNLTGYGASPINMRIGGDSTDGTGEPNSTTVEPFAELAEALGSHFELGVNLGANNVSLATNQAKTYVSHMPPGSVEAIEIGNEPDEYHRNGYRPSTYTTQDYFNDFNTWKENIQPVIPSNVKLMGASWAFIGTMQASLQSFADQQYGSLSSFSQHLAAASPGDNPADDYLLTPAASASLAQLVAPGVPITHALGLPFRMGEFTSISDGGIQNISDSFSAALWSIDTMFELANVGVDGVNWFASPNSTTPFEFKTTYSGKMASYSLSSVTPLYYGLLFFQVASGDGARILPVTLSAAANVKVWATQPTGRTPRVAIINKDENVSGNVAVQMPGYSQAQILRLTAPSYKSSNGVTFAGQTMDGSRTGYMQGTKTEETLYGNNGVFHVSMPITSAALVIFSN